MFLSSQSHVQRRGAIGSSSLVWIAIGCVAFGAIGLVLIYNLLRRLRIKHPEPPLWIRTSFLQGQWRKWQPATYSDLNVPLRSQRGNSVAHSSTEVNTTILEADIDRRQSVRSIMTLPPYHVAPLPSERLIAREGERAGVDTVIEYPESEAQAEVRREEEMSALFNIRQARRNEANEREVRREERRQARAAGDWRRLEVLEQESRARARERDNTEEAMVSTLQAADRGDINLPQPDSAYLIAELNSIRESASRSRRVSSVSYADLGLARHDGTRIRADSIESERPLLESAASIGGRRSRATSRASSQGRSRSIADQTRIGSRPDTAHIRHISDGMASYMSADSDDQGGLQRSSLLTPQSSADVPPEPPSYEDDVSVHGGDVPPYGEAPPYQSTTDERVGHSGSPLAYEAVRTPTSNEEGENDVELRRGVEAAAEHLAQTESHLMPEENQGHTTAEENDEVTISTTSIGSTSAASPSSVGGAAQKLLPLPLPKLVTKNRMPPAIEVLSATPVNSVPSTPVEGIARVG